MKIEIEISEDSLVDRIATQIRGATFTDEMDPSGRNLSLENKVRKIMADQVREATNIAVQRITEERITAAVDACLAEGWCKTDGYGSRNGPALTLKDRVSEILNQTSENYGRGRQNIVETKITEAVDSVLAKEFASVIAAAKTKFASLLDGTIAAKLQEAIKAGLGLAR